MEGREQRRQQEMCDGRDTGDREEKRREKERDQ